MVKDGIVLKVGSIDIESLEQFVGGDNIDEGLLYTTAWSLRKCKVVQFCLFPPLSYPALSNYTRFRLTRSLSLSLALFFFFPFSFYFPSHPPSRTAGRNFHGNLAINRLISISEFSWIYVRKCLKKFSLFFSLSLSFSLRKRKRVGSYLLSVTPSNFKRSDPFNCNFFFFKRFDLAIVASNYSQL